MKLRVPLLCGLMLLMQGVDVFGLSYVAPLLAADLALPAERLGIVFAATVLGSLAGATLLSPLADRIGRRPVMVIALLLTATGSLGVAFAHSLPALVALRLVVGVGFGASLPVAAASMAELAPPGRRALLVTLMSTSLVIGMSLAGLMTSLVAPVIGWRAQVVIASTFSLLVALVGSTLLPRDRRPTVEQPARGTEPLPLAALLQPQVLARSLLLCGVMTLAFAVMNFAGYWLPSMLVRDGLSIEQTGLIGSGRQLVTVLAGFLVGWAMDRAGTGRVLAVVHGLAAMLFLAVSGTAGIAVLVLLLAGMTVQSAGLSGLVALVSASYESSMRATALGWVQGIARVLGGTAGTWVGGLMIGAGWSRWSLAMAMGTAALCGLGGLLAVMRLQRSQRGELPGA